MKVGELKKELDQFSNDLDVVVDMVGLIEGQQQWGVVDKVERIVLTKENSWHEGEGPAVLIT